jgi:pimeloyl-ACP methyl ester carboxylesterase
VIPSMPGYGFSAKPTAPGWGPERIASAWITLMKRLGYKRFVAQGGDWGALITDLMGVQAPPELLGIHTNMAGVVPNDVNGAAFTGAPPPEGLSAEEKHAYDQLALFYKKGLGYAIEMANRPSASPLGYSIMIRRVTITSQNFLPAAPMAPSREKTFSIPSRSIG